jgi:hypothetical protein
LLISEACEIDRAGHAVLESLLCSERVFNSILGQSIIAENFAVTCWYLWWERRQAVNGEKIQPVSKSASAIMALIANFKAANSPKAKAKKGIWIKPQLEFLKINVDASFDANDLRGTTGAIMRDNIGEFIVASNIKIEHARDVLTVEAIALKQGLVLAQSLGCNRYYGI